MVMVMEIRDMQQSSERCNNWWRVLASWHGPHTADLMSYANADDQDWDEPATWDADPDLALEISDWLDVDSLLVLGGCLDAP